MPDTQLILGQKQELDNLSTIYLSDLQVLKPSHPARFSIICHPFSQKEEEYRVRLHIQLNHDYPKKPLTLEVEALVGVTSDNVASLQRLARDTMNESLGRPFVYDIVETAREWIQRYLVEGVQEQSEEDESKPIIEVFERPKYSTYTPVTAASFLSWKAIFQQEVNQEKRKRQAQLQQKMSGKQYFLKNEVMESDEDDEDAEGLDAYETKDNETKDNNQHKIQKEADQEDQDDEMWSPT